MTPIWRVSSKDPLIVYEGDRPVCQCHSWLDANLIVATMNRANAKGTDDPKAATASEDAWPDEAARRDPHYTMYCLGKILMIIARLPYHQASIVLERAAVTLRAPGLDKATGRALPAQPTPELHDSRERSPFRGEPRFICPGCGTEVKRNYITLLGPDEKPTNPEIRRHASCGWSPEARPSITGDK